jgi:heme exporter protein A
MTAMGIGHLAEVPVRMLSTGQRKRATLARVSPPALLWLLDRPANGLDVEGQDLLELMETTAPSAAILAASHQRSGWRRRNRDPRT